jgi:hypothetical protein
MSGKEAHLELQVILCTAGRLDSLLAIAPRLRVMYWHGPVAVIDGEPPTPEALGHVALTARRLLDRYVLVFDPSVIETRLTVEQQLFDLIAAQYECVIDTMNNRNNLRILLRLATRGTHRSHPGTMRQKHSPQQAASAAAMRNQSHGNIADWLEVLDYGCGTGLSATVAHEFPVRLTGCDISPAMLAQARQRGLRVLSHHELATVPDGYFDAIIAGYVLHLAIPSQELSSVCRTLRVGGHLAANFHKGYGYDEVSEILGRLQGFTALDVRHYGSFHHGRYGLWRRDA